MARRALRPKHQADIRAKIQGSQLIQFLKTYAFTGKYNGFEVEPKRIDAALGLLRKVLPDLSSTDATLTINATYTEVLARIAQADQVGNAALLRLDSEPAPINASPVTITSH